MYDAMIDEYARGGILLEQSIAGMTMEQLKARPIEGKWSTHEVVCHIADFEPIMTDRFKRGLAEDRPTVFGGNPDDFAQRLKYEVRDIDQEITMIKAVRAHTATLLRAITPTEFQREVVHSEAGPLTIEKLLTRTTNHILHHLKFIEEKRKALGC
jgi:uncharacterized damage-inducible protein DinB